MTKEDIDWHEEHERQIALLMECFEIDFMRVMQIRVEVELEEEL